jgi:cytochrome c553
MLALMRWIGIVAAAFATVVILAVGGVYAASERMLSKRYEVTAAEVAIPTDAVAVERGEHLTRAVATCTLCHGEDGGGGVYADMGLMGIVAGPNLTRGQGGIGGELSDADWVRAIRHGVRRDGTSLIVMPSEVYAHLSDADLGAIIAFLKRLPPVDREVPETRFGIAGRALLAAGKLNILVAPKTPAAVARPAVTPQPTAEYGRYLADISGCHGCHGYGLSGGRVAGPPGLPPASNLTVVGIGSWSEADFFRALREGLRPDGSALDDFMPWKVYARMSDDDVRALWQYLRSVPAREFGNK